ncbi:hypothetical protein J416_06048 [Gracilibacillus halophilus YIM-C55.5]|uniref:DUF4282 domain-containing protein n=1 Tax=Gracilibacillus halophilus YIM-C55.5 TaxID=1308866 RepID=N4WT94_9BACI|nr:hypothetical protein [Gracilibacillus halophilus]ENH97550.1 hypothetical protein J416_06048 [Gracilibacillus halophilus YIM-C55.5]
MSEDNENFNDMSFRSPRKDGTPVNTMSVILYYIGWLIIGLGLITGLVLATDYHQFILPQFLLWAGPCMISGIFFFALGEIVKQLTIINHRLHDQTFSSDGEQEKS